jgi:hypothetical protein
VFIDIQQKTVALYTVYNLLGFLVMYGLKAIVIGAGIGGLTAGIALRQAGYGVRNGICFNVKVYECCPVCKMIP